MYVYFSKKQKGDREGCGGIHRKIVRFQTPDQELKKQAYTLLKTVQQVCCLYAFFFLSQKAERERDY